MFCLFRAFCAPREAGDSCRGLPSPIWAAVSREFIPTPVPGRSWSAPLAAAAGGHSIRSPTCVFLEERAPTSGSGSRDRVCTLGVRRGRWWPLAPNSGASESESASPSLLPGIPAAGASRLLWGKVKRGEKPFSWTAAPRRNPGRAASTPVPSLGAPQALRSGAGHSGKLGELCRSGGTGAEVLGCAAWKPPADQRPPPQE